MIRSPSRADAKSAVDPVVTEIIRNLVVTITEEMKTNLTRTAYNVIIYEALDFTVGLFDPEGNVISVGIGLPMFIRGISETIRAKIRHFGLANMKPGDVLLTNDAYVTGSHLNHMTFSVPVFHDGEIVAFAGCMAHWQDVGGTINGMTTDIYTEGLQMPIVKFYKEGILNEDLLEVIRMNVRLPERAMGDLRAQIGCVKTGERRFLEMIGKYGKDTVSTSIAAIMDQSAAAAREEVKAIPDGVYEAESFMDDDGVEVGHRIPIKVKITVAGDKMTIDLSGVSQQVKGFYNCGETAGISCAQVAFKCLTSASDLPINEGSFRPLTVILPKGTVVSAVRPAAMRVWMTYPMTVVDTIFKAMAPALPQKVAAGHHADLMTCRTSGHHADGRLFLVHTGGIGGGWGAKFNEDGVSGTICINDGDTHNTPCEQVEAKFPVMVESFGLREDSCGAGQYRGGLGTQKTVKPLTDTMINIQCDRNHCRPWGLHGGLSGAGNQVQVQKAGEAAEYFPNGKVLARLVRDGDSYTLRSGGGGGYGSPLDRPVASVENDLRQGYISVRAALELYGVVADPRTLLADPEQTAARRDAMKRLGLPKDDPFLIRPQNEPHHHDHHHGHDHAPNLPAAGTKERDMIDAVMAPPRCC